MSSTKKELASGVLYTSLAKYSSMAVQLVVTAILARLLTPADYGVIAIATVFIVFFNLLSDIGIGPAIIQFKELDRHDLSHIFSFTAYVGVVMFVAFFCCSWLIADYYNNSTLIPVCQLLSAVIFIHCLNIVPQNLQYKNKRFRYTAAVMLIANVLTGIIAIVLALLGFGVFTLVIQQISSVALIFLFFYSQEKLPLKWKIDSKPLKRIFSFSAYQFLFNVINYFSRNLDKLLIGRYIGVAPLGQYEKSYRLMLLPLQNISFAISPVIQPIFSNFQNNLFELADKYKKLFELLCYVGFPLSILLFYSSKELILLFFGNQWHDAIFPFKIMALTVGLQILNGTTGAIYQSANATKFLFIGGCITAFLMVSAFLIAIFGWHTINAVAVCFSIAQLLNSIIVYIMLFKILRYPLTRIIRVMVIPIIITFIIGVALYLVVPFCDNLSLILSLVIKCLISLLIWFLCVNYASPYKGTARMCFQKIKKLVAAKLR